MGVAQVMTIKALGSILTAKAAGDTS